MKNSLLLLFVMIVLVVSFVESRPTERKNENQVPKVRPFTALQLIGSLWNVFSTVGLIGNDATSSLLKTDLVKPVNK